MQILFFIFALLAILAALVVVLGKNPVNSAVALILVLFSLAAVYVLLGAYFISIVQIMVYAGAIMVLFIFVVMLLNLRGLEMEESPSGGWGLFGMIAAVVTAVLIVPVMFVVVGRMSAESVAGVDNTARIGELLYSKYLLPFELTSFLLLAAMVGVIVLVKKKSDATKHVR